VEVQIGSGARGKRGGWGVDIPRKNNISLKSADYDKITPLYSIKTIGLAITIVNDNVI